MIVPALTTVAARADRWGADSMGGVATTMLARRVMDPHSQSLAYAEVCASQR
jgi:hypothetical protein